MNLSGVLNSARSALDAATAQTALVSRNIAGASDAGYSRKSIETGYGAAGLARAEIRRAQSPGLAGELVRTTAKAAADSSGLDILTRLRGLFGGIDAELSPGQGIGVLGQTLSAAAADPSDPVMAARAVAAASDLASGIRAMATGVASVRSDIEQALAGHADTLNGLLQRFEGINSRVVNGSHAGADTTDLQDERDGLLRQMSDIIGVSAIRRGDNDMVLQTDGGVVLFETRARPVSYAPAEPLVPGAPGGRFLVDGVAVAGPGAVMASTGGAVAGLVAVRDGAAASLETRLDETARGLIMAFRESDRSVPSTLPDIAGLFTDGGSASLPATGGVVAGLAQRLTVAASVDPARGGNAMLLRDGGIGAPGNPAYVANAGGASAFPDRLVALAAALETPQGFDGAAGLGDSRSVSDFAVRMFAAFEDSRQSTTASAEFSGAVSQRAADALTAETGVSLDAEMSRLLEIEQAYGASARLIATVGTMFDTLMAAVR